MKLLRTTLGLAAIAFPVMCGARLPGLTVGITGGMSLPAGNFALADYNNLRSGFARPGANLGLTATAGINQHWGVTAMAAYTTFGFTGGAQLAEGYKDAFGVDSSSFIQKGSNYTFSLLAGPYYTIGVSKLHLDLRLMGGLVRASLAGNEITMEDNAEATFIQQQSYASSPGIQAGAAVRYNLGRKVDIAAGADYAWSQPSFTIENVNRRNAAGRLLSAYNEPVTAMNINLSLLYRIR
jgi:hypothetical protein